LPTLLKPDAIYSEVAETFAPFAESSYLGPLSTKVVGRSALYSPRDLVVITAANLTSFGLGEIV
jgi:hypothetical protein